MREDSACEKNEVAKFGKREDTFFEIKHHGVFNERILILKLQEHVATFTFVFFFN